MNSMYNYDDIPCLMLDLDMTIADFYYGYEKAGRLLYPSLDMVIYDNANYDLSARYNIEREQSEHIFREVDYSVLLPTPELVYIKDLLYRKINGTSIVKRVKIVTARTPNPSNMWQTIQWLLDNDVRYDNLIFNKHKWESCEDVTHIMEDNQECVDKIVAHYPNVVVIPISRAWNNQ